jgi:hypothetical protein
MPERVTKPGEATGSGKLLLERARDGDPEELQAEAADLLAVAHRNRPRLGNPPAACRNSRGSERGA